MKTPPLPSLAQDCEQEDRTGAGIPARSRPGLRHISDTSAADHDPTGGGRLPRASRDCRPRGLDLGQIPGRVHHVHRRLVQARGHAAGSGHADTRRPIPGWSRSRSSASLFSSTAASSTPPRSGGKSCTRWHKISRSHRARVPSRTRTSTDASLSRDRAPSGRE